jgi:hypothetical protein
MSELASMDDTVYVIKVYQPLQDRFSYRTDNVDRNRATTTVYLVE